MQRSMFSVANAYDVGAVRTRGHVCRTNISSNTAFRGFGNPQGMFVIESILERLAFIVGKSLIDIRSLNMVRPGVCVKPLPFGYCTSALGEARPRLRRQLLRFLFIPFHLTLCSSRAFPSTFQGTCSITARRLTMTACRGCGRKR